MVDLHCHILPSADDGAQTLDDAVEMAQIAVADGITDILTTPHTLDGYYRNDKESVIEAVDAFQQVLDYEGIPLRVHPGSEVHIHVEFLENILSSRILTVRDERKYVLLELPVQSIPRFTEDLLYELQVEGITPIIAHPERNAVLREDPNRLAEWVQQGVLAQVTAGSLLGHMGERSKATAERMILNRLVHVIASDAHNASRRRPELSRAYRALADLTSMEDERRFQSNAHAILAGERVRKREPIFESLQPKKKRFFFF